MDGGMDGWMKDMTEGVGGLSSAPTNQDQHP